MSSSSSSWVVPKLFQPTKIGPYVLTHRVVLAPLTRTRASAEHVHGEISVEYYAQRASVPGTLLISEATFIAARAGGQPNVPGIWSDEQVVAWKRVTDAIHARGCRMISQLWAIGRCAIPDVLKAEDPSFPYISASDIPLKGNTVAPRPMTIPEIKEYVQLYVAAAKNALRAGFDGVEVHCANGFLLDQFLQDVSNHRTDEYGGSVENRCRFPLEVVAAVVAVVGAERVGVRVSPWNRFQDMRMVDPKPTYAHYVSSLAAAYPNLAYISVVEPRGNLGDPYEPDDSIESNDFIREIWAPRRVISAGGFTRETGFAHAERTGDLVAYGRPYIANPDLPVRLARNLPLATGDRSHYFFPATGPEGYIDYPVAEDL